MDFEELWVYVLAYLIGSIPTAVWFGEVFYNKDVRKHGSGNAGATNTFRVLGTTAGIAVLTIDILKGILAMQFVDYLSHSDVMPNPGYTLQQIELGLLAVLGHIFSVFLRFKGGKGVATFFGVILYLFPWVALVCVTIFFIIFFFTHYVSLSSILASLAFTLAIYFIYFRSNTYQTFYFGYGYSEWPYMIFAFLVPIIICITHRKNISRLMNGTETKMYFSKKENQS